MNAVAIQYREPILHRSDEVFREFFALPQFLLCPLALSDATRKNKNPPPSGIDIINTDLNIYNSPILTPVPGFKAIPANLHYLLDTLSRFSRCLYRFDIRYSHGQHFISPVTYQTTIGVVCVQNPPLRICNPKTIHRSEENSFIFLLLPLALSDVSCDSPYTDHPTFFIPYRIHLVKEPK